MFVGADSACAAAPKCVACLVRFESTSGPTTRSTAYIGYSFSSRRRHTRFDCDWSSDVCSSDLFAPPRVLPFATRVQKDTRLRGERRLWTFGNGKSELCARLRKLPEVDQEQAEVEANGLDRKSTRLNSSHSQISYAVFCLTKKTD